MSELYDEGIIGLGPDDERMGTGSTLPFDESPVDLKKREGRSRAPRHPKSALVSPEPSPTATGGGSHFSGESNSRSSSVNSRSSAASRRSQRDRPWRSDKNPQQSSSSLTSSNNSVPPQQINRVDSSDSFDSMGRMVKSTKEDLSDFEQRADEISIVSNSSSQGPPKAAFYAHERAAGSYHCPSEPPPMSMAPPNPPPLPPAPAGPPPPPPADMEQAPPSPLYTNSRWSQYESNPDELQREADIASATAVASAAERAAYRQVKNAPNPEKTGESVLVLSMDDKDEASEESSEYNEELSLMTEDYNGERGDKHLTPKQHASRWDDYDDPTGRVPMEKRLYRNGGPPVPPERQSVPASPPVWGSLGHSLRSGRDMLMSAVMGSPQDDFVEDEVDFRRRSRKNNDHDRVRAEALKMLELAEDATGGSQSDLKNPSAIGNDTGTLRKTKTGGWTTAQDNDEGMGMSRPDADTNGKRMPSALQGMDMGNHKERSDPYNEARKRLYSMDDDDDDGVDVVKTSIGGFGGVRAMDRDDDASLLEEDYLNGQEGGSNGKSWSQRYSIAPHLRAITGGKMASSTDILHAMDEQHRPNKSATNMFKSSAYNMDGDGGRRALNIHSGVPTSSGGKPLFMDIDLAERSSFPPPPHPSTRKRSPVDEFKEKAKRRQLLLLFGAVVGVACLIAALIGSLGKRDDGANDFSAFGNAPGSTFSFYATSNVPFTDASGKELAKELAEIPADSFLIHLGDVGLADETFCDEDVYSDASTILEASAAPVFVLPGNNDWNDCPDPDDAWNYWDTYLGEFERHFSQSFDVGRQLGRNENFVFLHEGVLFIGVNLVNGRVHDRSEWNKRHAQNVLWTEQNLQLYEYNEYRAVVIFGHSPPYDLLTDYFHPVVDDLARIKKPVLYMHANNDGKFREYRPFGKAGGDQLLAVEVDAGGDDATVLKVTVDFGSSPFIFDKESSSN